jgi:hypothetical protein
MTTPSTPFRVGVEGILPGADDWFATIYGCWFGKYFTEEQLGMALREVGADFTLFYDSLAPKKLDACRRIGELCARLGLPFLFNNTYGDIQGPWIEGYGRAEYAPAQLRAAAATGLFRGVVWDEVEHRQLHQYDTGTQGPYFFDPAGLSVEACYERMVQAVAEVVDRYAAAGAASVGEYVFPASLHTLARAGMIPAPKVLKESFNPLMLALAIGAARQYDRECWAVADLWGADYWWGSRTVTNWGEGGNPGHGPDEYLSALLLCYWMGLDAVYTEALYNLIVPVTTTPEEWAEIDANPFRHRGVENPLVVNYRRKGYVLTVYGKYHRWFTRAYLPRHPRPYTFREVRPEVAVICLPDTTWARRDGVAWWASRETLFGPGGPPKAACHEALLDVMHLLSHGVVPRAGMSYWNEPYASRRAEMLERYRGVSDPTDYPYDDQHTGFCPLNGVIVYDHRVGETLLCDVPLLICTGELLSDETARAVLACVERGATCLALPHLFPAVAGMQEIAVGNGRLVLTDDMAGPTAQAVVAPHLGPADAVRYRFGKTEVCLRPLNGDECRLGVTVEDMDG